VFLLFPNGTFFELDPSSHRYIPFATLDNDKALILELVFDNKQILTIVFPTTICIVEGRHGHDGVVGIHTGGGGLNARLRSSPQEKNEKEKS